jgi:hypothetical protein
MTDYKFSLEGVDSTKKTGAPQPYNTGPKGENYGGSGAIPAVCGSASPVVVATGAENNGGKRA